MQRTLLASLLALASVASAACSGASGVEETATNDRGPAAMVSARENWTDVRVTVLGDAATDRRGFVAVEVRLDELRAVPGFVALPTESAATTAVLLLRVETAGRMALRPGERLEARVRRGRDARVLFADERTLRRLEALP